MPSAEIKRRRAAAYRKGLADGMAAAAEMLQEIADKTEAEAYRLGDRWTEDLGATAETKAAGIAAHIITGICGEIIAAQIKLERKASPGVSLEEGL